MNNKKYLVIGLVILIVLGLGCVENTPTESGTDKETIPVTVDPVTTTNSMNIEQPTMVQNDDDSKFLSLIKEAVDALSQDRKLLPSSDLPNDKYFKELKIYGQSLENDADKYITKLVTLSVSSKMIDAYNEYKNYLEYNKLAGGRCKLAADYYERGDADGATRNLNKCAENTDDAAKHLDLATTYLKSTT